MKARFALLILCLMSWLAACRKDSGNLQDAVITGYDLRMCACCGGFMINLGNDTTVYAGSMYLADTIPQSINLSRPWKFPMRIRMSWFPDTSICGKAMNKIVVTHAELR
jgi:hypothetical protein